MSVGLTICVIVGILAATLVGVYFVHEWSEVQKIRYKPRSLADLLTGAKKAMEEKDDSKTEMRQADGTEEGDIEAL